MVGSLAAVLASVAGWPELLFVCVCELQFLRLLVKGCLAAELVRAPL